MESQQQFCLKWNSFGSNLATAFGNLFKSESLTDVTLFCEGVSFRVHRVILAACSKHFQDLFERAPLPPSALIILDGTSATNLGALLEFMYKGEVHVSQESLSSFLKAAEGLQVKGLSIDHETLTTQEHFSRENQLESPCNRKQPKLITQSTKDSVDPSDSHLMHGTSHAASTSYSPSLSVISPYIPHYRTFDRAAFSMPPASGYDRHEVSRKRYGVRVTQASPSQEEENNMQNVQDNVRASVLRETSVLRDGKAESEMLPPAHPLPYRPSLSIEPSMESEQKDEGFTHSDQRFEDQRSERRETVTFDRTAAVDDNTEGHRSSGDAGSISPEDLRVKMEPSVRVEEHTNTLYNEKSSSNIDTGAEVPSQMWNSDVKTYAQKSGSTPAGDGKKLQCPFCERLYGYETNLRAHIRQRHQGIRVPCPFCSRTFTRNNTVRRHIAREHKTEISLKMIQTQVSNHNQ